MFAAFCNVEFTNVYLIFWLNSFLNLFLHDVLILHNVLILIIWWVFKILPTCFCALPTCFWSAFGFYSHNGLVFVERVFYVCKIWVTIIEQVYCICLMRFFRFFRALFAYKRHAWACISHHVRKRHFGTGWVIWDFADLALQCWRLKLCLAIATQYFVWWSRAPVRNHCCCSFWYLYFQYLLLLLIFF